MLKRRMAGHRVKSGYGSPAAGLLLAATCLLLFAALPVKAADYSCKDGSPTDVVEGTYKGQKVSINAYSLFCGSVAQVTYADGKAGMLAVGYNWRKNEDSNPDTITIYSQPGDGHPATQYVPYFDRSSGVGVATGLYALEYFGVAETGDGASGSVVKPVSALFPTQCTQSQVLQSIARASLQPDGMSYSLATADGDSAGYCLDDTSVPFHIIVDQWTGTGGGDNVSIVEEAYPDMINPYPSGRTPVR